VLILVTGLIPWRQWRFYSGQFDWVVLGKTGLVLAALVIVLWAKGNIARSGRSINTVPALALILLALYLCSSTLGALLSDNLFASVALSAREFVVGYVILVLLELAQPMVIIRAVSRILAATSIFVAATGTFDYPQFAGRIMGNYPPVTPNEIAFLAAVPMVYFFWRTVNVDTNLGRTLVLVTLGVILCFTLSRTATVVAALVILFLTYRGTREWRLRLIISAGLAICLLFIFTFTRVIQAFATRGDTSPVGELNNRPIAWNAVLDSARNPMQFLFGEGLAKTTVPIVGHFWKFQTLDSSWVTAFVQAGLIGSVVALVMVIYAVGEALRNARPVSDLWLALLAFIVVRSILESGLFVTSATFLVFMVVSLSAASQAHLRRHSDGNPIRTLS
jgi:hypothetical protein